MEIIARNYEQICYGCRSRMEMNYLLDVDNDEESGYRDFPGPFTDFPSSVLEDLVYVMSDLRGLPKQMLHQIILPQLEVKMSIKSIITKYFSELRDHLQIIQTYSNKVGQSKMQKLEANRFYQF